MGDTRRDSGEYYPGGKVIPRQPTGGGGGADGATFFPSVSPEGVISWQNNQGRENPPQRNIKGPKGDDGTSPRIGENGNWWIGETDTGIPAQGPKGEPGDDGDDGTSPHIGENGNWFVGTHDTGVHAQGPKGEDGTPLDTSMPETEPTEDNHGLTKRGIWSWVKSLLPSWLTTESEEPRGKTEMRVFEETFTPWAGTLPDGWSFEDPQPIFLGIEWKWYLIDDGGNSVEAYAPGGEDAVSLVFSTHVDIFTATRTKSATPSDTDKLAHTSATSGLAKFGEDGELEAATPSSTGGEYADFRDPQDNACHKTEFGEWIAPNKPQELSEQPIFIGEISPGHYDWAWRDYPDEIFNFLAHTTEEHPTELTFSFNEHSFTATRQRVATKDEPFVTFDVVSALVYGVKTLLGTVASPFSTFADWIASKYTKPTGGIPKTDLAAAVQTLLGKADTALQSHQDISGKANRTAFADAYVATQSYVVGDVVDYNGVVYQCVSETSGGEWDASKWEARKLDDFFRNSNSLLLSTIRYSHYSVPLGGALKDRAINDFTFTGSLPNFPAQVSGYARDFLLNVTATADGSDIALPEAGATSVGDALAFEAGKTYLVAVTEIAAKKYYIRVIDTTPANAA